MAAATVRRWLKRLVRAAAWAAKAALAAVAVAAVVAWPWSCARPGGFDGSRREVGAGRVDSRVLVAGWGEGRVGFRWVRSSAAVDGPWYSYARPRAPVGRPAWTWTRLSAAQLAALWRGRSAWGPVRWEWADTRAPAEATAVREASLPLWLVALAAGAWPAASAALWTRRRRLEGNRCGGCGYDVRATPDANGPTLAACPECGRPAPSTRMR